MSRTGFRVTVLLTLVVHGICCVAVSSAASPGPAERIRVALDRGDVDAAIAIGEPAAAMTPGDSETWLWLGRAYGRKAQTASVFSRIGFAKKCRGAFEKAVEADPRNLDAAEDLFSYYLHAPGIVGGSREKARELAETLWKLDPVSGQIAKGRILAAEKDYAGSEAVLARAVEAEPGGYRGAVALGNLYVGQKRWTDARAFWQGRLDSAPPGDALAHFHLARVAYLSGTELEKGVGHLEAYLAVPPLPGRPTWADAHWRLGLLYEKLERRNEARVELQAALTLSPGHAQARKDLERLRE